MLEPNSSIVIWLLRSLVRKGQGFVSISYRERRQLGLSCRAPCTSSLLRQYSRVVRFAAWLLEILRSDSNCDLISQKTSQAFVATKDPSSAIPGIATTRCPPG